jgi:hypothetical protein
LLGPEILPTSFWEKEFTSEGEFCSEREKALVLE